MRDLAVVANVDEIVGDEDVRLERLKRLRVVEVAEGHVVAADGEPSARRRQRHVLHRLSDRAALDRTRLRGRR